MTLMLKLLEELCKTKFKWKKTYNCDFVEWNLILHQGKCQHKKICKNKPISSDEK
jgi:hypothetical protein